ncbi:MAG TPA: hypothetical protein VFZ77_14160, partial [Acidimicrobiales bacterium]
VSAWRHRRSQVGRLEPLDGDGGAAGDVLAVRPQVGDRPRPQVAVPGRPPELAEAAVRAARRRRLVRLGVLGLASGAGALAAGGVRRRSARP